MANKAISDLTEAVIAEDDLIEFTDQSDSPATSRRDTVRGILDLVPYDLPCGVGSTPSASEILARFTMVRTLQLPANFSGSLGSQPDTAPDSEFPITIQSVDNSVSPASTTTLGTVTISTAGAYTFSTQGGTAKTVSAGEEVQMVAPSGSPVEASIAGFSFTLMATVSS